MLISYEPNSDILTITFEAAPLAQTQMQGAVSVGFDANGAPISVSLPNASSVLWENGGQINVMLPQPQTIVTQQVVPANAAVPSSSVVASVVEERKLL